MVTQQQKPTTGVLAFIERLGNRVPDITILFIGAFIIVCIISAILSTMTFGYVNPATGKQLQIINMLSPQSLITLMSKMVTNYSGFPPFFIVIVVTLCLGISEVSVYFNIALRIVLSITP